MGFVVRLCRCVFGAAVGEFRAGGFVALWSVSGQRERGRRETVRGLSRAILETVAGSFEIPRSTRGQGSRGRALRVFRGSVPAGGRAWNLARRSADRDVKF